MKVILDVKDSKLNIFMDFINTLDYVTVDEETEVPQWQQKEVTKRLQLVEKGTMKTRSWSEAKKDIFSK